jgi:hypothetical protein
VRGSFAGHGVRASFGKDTAGAGANLRRNLLEFGGFIWHRKIVLVMNCAHYTPVQQDDEIVAQKHDSNE